MICPTCKQPADVRKGRGYCFACHLLVPLQRSHVAWFAALPSNHQDAIRKSYKQALHRHEDAKRVG